VDESIFGEPLKNRWMLARSKSMEDIAGMNLQQEQQRALIRQVNLMT